MEVLLLLVMGAVNVVCFMIGVKVGQATAKGEEVKLPSVKPAEAVQEHKAQEKVKLEKTQLEAILQNIDKYDGTEQGQVDVPWR